MTSALVIGRPGSGKSTLLHTLIVSLALNYSPDELQLYLLDLKQVEFEDYASYQLPHARVVAIQSEREFGLSVLRGLSDEMKARSDLFRNMHFVSLNEYRNKTGNKMPRILLVIDEFQELFSEDDSISNEAALLLDRLIKMGRAFGINTLLASQTLTGPYSLDRSTKDLIQVRIALQCADAESRQILSDENDQATLLERPGEAIYNSKNGRLEGNSLFQVFFLPPDRREKYLRDINDLAKKSNQLSPVQQIVFRGDALADIESNKGLESLVNANEWQAPRPSYKAWLGDPVEIKPHTSAVFRRQSRSNLLIIGQNRYEASAASMLLAGLCSLAVQHHPDTASFNILNMTDVDTNWHELFDVFADCVPHSATVVRRRAAASSLESIDFELNRRLAERDDVRWPAIYLVIAGLHRARDLRANETDDDTSDDVSKSASAQLAAVVRDGPDVGIHTLIWCDTYSNLERVLEFAPEREFEMRVALQMNADDSQRLLDTYAASKIGPYRAIFYDEDRTGRLEKFRPYEVPTAEWIASLGEELRARV